MDSLDNLRKQIDTLDEKIVELLKKRYELVDKAVEIKKIEHLEIYSKDRENSIKEHFKSMALKHSLSSDFLDEIFKKFVNESYKSSLDETYPCTTDINSKIVIVGGNGGMGKFFTNYFKKASYTVEILEKDDWDRVVSIVEKAKAVIVSVPIDVTLSVIKKLAPHLKNDTVLCDLTSVKKDVVNVIKHHYKGPSLSLHPMFGPDTKNFVKQVVVNVSVNDEAKCDFLIRQLAVFGARVVNCSALEHDEAMSIIQALRHFTTYCYGVFLSKTNANIDKILELSSPIYRLELTMVGRLFAQDPMLYGDIIMSSSHNKDLIYNYFKNLHEELDVILNDNLDEFIKRFKSAREYFGTYADTFLKESATLLLKYQEIR